MVGIEPLASNCHDYRGGRTRTRRRRWNRRRSRRWWWCAELIHHATRYRGLRSIRHELIHRRRRSRLSRRARRWCDRRRSESSCCRRRPRRRGLSRRCRGRDWWRGARASRWIWLRTGCQRRRSRRRCFRFLDDELPRHHLTIEAKRALLAVIYRHHDRSCIANSKRNALFGRHVDDFTCCQCAPVFAATIDGCPNPDVADGFSHERQVPGLRRSRWCRRRLGGWAGL